MTSVVADNNSKGRSLGGFLVSAFLLLVGLWVFRGLYSLVRNVLIAQNCLDMALAILLLVATVAVSVFIAAYAWSLFCGMPVVVSACEDEFNPTDLGEKIRDEYLACLPSEEEYARRLGIAANADLPTKLKELRSHDGADARSFVSVFKEFQRLQDEMAGRVIRKYSLLIALKTAASPWRLLDMIAVFHDSTMMICQLAGIYNRRTSRVGAFRLAVRWTFNLYVSGIAGQVAEGAADVVNSQIGNWLGEQGLSGLMRSSVPMLSKFAGRATEGGLNAYLAYRLGRRAVGEFCYLRSLPQNDLRTLLAVLTAKYLDEKLALNRRETLAELLAAYRSGAKLGGKAADHLLKTELLVGKQSDDSLRYSLRLLVLMPGNRVIRAVMDVPYDDDWAFAPSAFRERFIRERMDELLVDIYSVEDNETPANA